MFKTRESCGKPLEKLKRSDYHERNKKYNCKKCYNSTFKSGSSLSVKNTMASSSQIFGANMNDENVMVMVDLSSVKVNIKKCISVVQNNV